MVRQAKHLYYKRRGGGGGVIERYWRDWVSIGPILILKIPRWSDSLSKTETVLSRYQSIHFPWT